MQLKAFCLGEAIVDFISVDGTSWMEATHFTRCLGGAGANIAIGLKHFGIDSELIGRVGKDKLGTFVVNELNRHNLSIQHLQEDSTKPTKCSFIGHDVNENRFIEIANRDSADQQIDMRSIRPLSNPFQLLYVSGVALLGPIGFDVVLNALDRARDQGAIVAFDPVFDVAKASNVVRERIFSILANVDVLKVNDAEYKALESYLLDSPAFSPSVVVRTLGPAGLLVEYAQNSIQIAANDAPCVDPTGAGDALFSAFLATLLLDGASPEELIGINASLLRLAGEAGAKNAAQIIQQIGAVDAYLIR